MHVSGHGHSYFKMKLGRVTAFRAVHLVIGAATLVMLAFFVATQLSLERLRTSIEKETIAAIEKHMKSVQ